MKIQCKYLRIYVILLTCALGTSLEISERHKLLSIEDGSSEVILDCPYELKEDDIDGLVIKWFYEDELIPSFQWIPSKHEFPQDIGILKGRIDVSHSITSDKYSEHRALYIKKPSLDLSGLYTCYVSNYVDEDIAEVQLTVYIPANNFTIDYNETEDGSVTFICEADGVFPKPSIEFFSKQLNGPHRIKLMEENVSIEFDNSTETYNATLYKTFSLEELNPSNYFGCLLKINQTVYELEVGLEYFTEPPSTSIVTTPDTLIPVEEMFTKDDKSEDLYLESIYSESSSTKIEFRCLPAIFTIWCFVYLTS